MIKNAQSLSDLSRFHEVDDDDSVKMARKFVLLMYGKKAKKLEFINDLRYRFATTTDKPASMLPPTEDAFRQYKPHCNATSYYTHKSWMVSL